MMFIENKTDTQHTEKHKHTQELNRKVNFIWESNVKTIRFEFVHKH